MRGLLLAGLLAAGCDAALPPPAPAPTEPGGSRPPLAFDPARAGSVTGRVAWDGPAPHAPPFARLAAAPAGGFLTESFPNPHAPVVAPTGGLAGAVVFLRNYDAARAAPWNLPPVAVEMRGRQFRVVQGGRAGAVGFVRRGDAVTFTSRDAVPHGVEARGANYLSLKLPDPGKSRSRTLDAAGAVELSSGTGHFWMKAHLFVGDHPYFAVTDAGGRFRIDRVPAGPCEVVAWHPNWRVARAERDPETGLELRHVHGLPLEDDRPVRVVAGADCEVALTLSDWGAGE